jgi:hypothetical protein
MECSAMRRGYFRGFTASEKTELWDRWQRGESLKRLGERLVSHHRQFIFSWPHTGEFVPRHGAAQGWH